MSLASGVAPLRFLPSPLHARWARPNSLFSPAQLLLWQKRCYPSIGTSRWCFKAFASGVDSGPRRRNVAPGWFEFDTLLSVLEVVCVAPSVVLAVGGVVGSIVPRVPRVFQVNSGNVTWQFFLLVGAVVVGGLIRERRWRRVCVDDGVLGCDLVGRIEKLEDDLRSSVKVVRVLSRQLEKLGIRFRVTRKALKEPIAETATLAQKNSEATRVLALQEDILEKELGEVQKVLLAMQEQQQKQLDLILAVAKAGQLFESKGDPSRHGSGKNIVPEKEGLKQTEVKTERKQETTNDMI